MRRVVEVSDEGQLRPVRRPTLPRHPRALRHIHGRRATRHRIDDLESNAGSLRQVARAIRFGIDLKAREIVPGLSEHLQRRHAVAVPFKEKAPRRTLIREGDVEMSRREHESLDVRRGPDVRLARQDRGAVVAVRLRALLRGERCGSEREDENPERRTSRDVRHGRGIRAWG